MQRDPNWSAELAEQVLAEIAADEGPITPLVFVPTGEGARDLTLAEPGPEGVLTAGSDLIDFIELELDENAAYTFLSLGRTTEGVAETQIFIIDDEGYPLVAIDGNDLAVEQDGTDTIWQFRPGYTGTYYLSIAFDNPENTGDYGIAALGNFGELDEDTGNIAPVVVDDVIATERFVASVLPVLSTDFDEDGDQLEVIEIFERSFADSEETIPIQGFAAVVDGEIIYRSPGSFTGSTTFGYTVSDGNGGTDTGVVVIEVSEGLPVAEGEATRSEAQRIAYLYEAGLNRNGNIDTEGLNFWIDANQTFTLVQIANFFIESDEFAASFGDPDTLSDEDFVRTLYENVLNREADQEGFDFWFNAFQDPEIFNGDRGLLLLGFTDSGENLIGSPEVAEIVYTDADSDGSFEWVV
ncbi:hypothetical protein LNKW23_01410 [Paralimibaculum aggregatum]|uniref:DUF4214 domain-containing protein n=1 Tax=Paralimibaculum aggregatum TaxID=3036245 RepID=A0ABQ6LC16_9RHOB|nr:DUF4214 domain-containing protein [Limibaculum sp. NKW23]GMG80929.1 hypothetical protein LNKW23_01410 [Limibaculum sp. NKW23]